MKHPYKESESTKREDGTLVLVVGKNVYSYIKRAFPSAEKDGDCDGFYRNKCKCIVGEKEESCLVTFLITQVPKVTYLDIEIKGKSKAKIINCLEQVQDKLLNSGVREYYIDVISYDAISEHYCNKMSTKLNALERNLRKLLFNIYILHFGEDYYKVTMNAELQEKIKGLIGSSNAKEYYRDIKKIYNVNSDQAKAIVRLQQFFYSFEFADIQKFLFTPSWTSVDEEARTKFLSKHKNLSELSDEELREAFAKTKPRSDWERFFSSKIHISEIEDVIDCIRIYRNSVAHFKFFYRKDYMECNRLILPLNKAILEAIKITEEKDFAEKNAEALSQALSGVSERISEMMKSVYEAAIKFTQSATYQTLQRITQKAKESRVIENLGRFAIKMSERIDESNDQKDIDEECNIEDDNE